MMRPDTFRPGNSGVATLLVATKVQVADTWFHAQLVQKNRFFGGDAVRRRLVMSRRLRGQQKTTGSEGYSPQQQR